MHFLVPSVRIEGEVVGEPQTSTVTNVFWVGVEVLTKSITWLLVLEWSIPSAGACPAFSVIRCGEFFHQTA